MPNANVEFNKVEDDGSFPSWTNRTEVVNFIHETMKPYHDEIKDIQSALDYAFSRAEGKGGFLMLVGRQDKLVGALLMQNTGMGGYIPENILLFVTVSPDLRGQGVGRKLIEYCIAESDGNVKLHVEYDNPAKRLYERIGFSNKYAEMRFNK
ncbi:GNAT family N-acetyltransferase [Calditrichota bacterium]